jgi:hypothetical protein
MLESEWTLPGEREVWQRLIKFRAMFGDRTEPEIPPIFKLSLSFPCLTARLPLSIPRFRLQKEMGRDWTAEPNQATTCPR